MAGLDPAIHATAIARISTMRAPSHAGRMGLHRDEPPNGVLYTGVTSDLARRAWEHREGVAEGFTKRYGLKLLVYAERHDDIRIAIQRERNLHVDGRVEPGHDVGEDMFLPKEVTDFRPNRSSIPTPRCHPPVTLA
jgi:predicted GIY-YIG superfamily endonuclease